MNTGKYSFQGTKSFQVHFFRKVVHSTLEKQLKKRLQCTFRIKSFSGFEFSFSLSPWYLWSSLTSQFPPKNFLVRNYKSYEEISRALADQEVKGALVDLYVLSSHNHLFNDPRFRIVRIYDFKTSYGVVLAGNSMKLEQCFTEHIKAYSGSVFQKIEDNIKFLRVRLHENFSFCESPLEVN